MNVTTLKSFYVLELSFHNFQPSLYLLIANLNIPSSIDHYVNNQIAPYNLKALIVSNSLMKIPWSFWTS